MDTSADLWEAKTRETEMRFRLLKRALDRIDQLEAELKAAESDRLLEADRPEYLPKPPERPGCGQ